MTAVLGYCSCVGPNATNPESTSILVKSVLRDMTGLIVRLRLRCEVCGHEWLVTR